MENEIPLPPPPRIRHRSPANAPHASSGAGTFRKTYQLSRFDDRSSQPSSDPALFSSDDIPASGLENYNAPVPSGSRKRRYRGTWWGEMVKDPKRKRADFKDKRMVDSGVWMGSDESGADSLLPSEDASTWGEDLLKETKNSGVRFRPQGHMITQQRPVFQRSEESREHQLARAIVNDCLEKGQDSVDLSSGNLRTVPWGLLRPLQHLTKLPTVKEPPISEEVYSSLEPFLRLFLAGNSLTAISGELFELGSLRVLSLRNNKLTEIPPAIRKLTMLQEVNLSVNRLQCLPWEFLWLIKKGDLKHLTVRPNPLLQIEDADIAQWHSPEGTDPDSPEGALKLCEYEGPAPEEAWAPIHVATGCVRRFNMEGKPVGEDQTNMYMNRPTEPESESRVPSLREVSLVSFNKSPYFDQIPDSEMEDYPELILRLLRRARAVRDGGGRSCTVCHRSFVIARTEWIEWWDCSTYENGLKGPRCPGEKLRPLPFRRLGCSPLCVPAAEDFQPDAPDPRSVGAER
ncbi:leucine rich repeat domain protein [Aspergillus steynii IBT 23096]|uniref:Leucine rich repeat domain protein n=1 Tax=Aspergillus steynii IBT 23096 TaxID=1392250 RepID=A0A2I2FYM6_9EURO|nr:leucine rich repeat domain protein [Aspergillus steynii IBT 23096]PLB45728.1 leucine rich repeat domain protein [Aspergillus steynii IBT 23096]